ncbi:putative RNA-directed DNA polymerase from transposon BS [Trichonephila clavata]|uniref:Putative RNA-directed DNA polymerase from transposon BS n=1 Tax=Trichonephila clavata TaxID=2740835 RepID=A0A8X6KYN1_TRICU|nr:putative RNA-directed DNA polymerase from transposon BS [Trichonephila clavata]
MIECRLREFLEQKGTISYCQAGFRRHKSTMEQVMKLTQTLRDGFHRRQPILAVLVDFKAAYDNVWHKRLLHKFKKHGAPGKLLNWVQNFLSQRNIRCRFLNATFPWKQLRQGMPQGSVLSCILFHTMINDLGTAIQKVSGVSCLFAA